MFDIGFQEIALIGVIALIVVGPERLPKMARTLGLWAGKIRYYVNQVKDDIDREVRAQELKEMLDKPADKLDALYEVARETKDTLDEAKAVIESVPTDISTANEPAAGSILPNGLPNAGAEPTAGPDETDPVVTEPAAGPGETHEGKPGECDTSAAATAPGGNNERSSGNI